MRFVFLLLILSSCSRQESFEEFYLKFHQDSAFQKERIVFPLEGLPPSAEVIEEFYWQEDEWIFQSVIPDAALYHFEDVVIEVTHVGEYAMQRRFAIFGEEWYLIYYAGLNLKQ